MSVRSKHKVEIVTLIADYCYDRTYRANFSSQVHLDPFLVPSFCSRLARIPILLFSIRNERLSARFDFDDPVYEGGNTLTDGT